MYSTKLKDERFLVECVAILGRARVIQYVVDTGAKFTCCNYKELDKHMCEKDFAAYEAKIIGGFVEGIGVKFYRCRLRQFTIGNIDMKAQDIWITFDKRVKETVLGMDILKQVIMITNPYEQKVYFCKDAEDYEKNFRLKVG